MRERVEKGKQKLKKDLAYAKRRRKKNASKAGIEDAVRMKICFLYPK